MRHHLLFPAEIAETPHIGQQFSNLTVHITALKKKKKEKSWGKKPRSSGKLFFHLLKKGPGHSSEPLGAQTGLEGSCIC